MPPYCVFGKSKLTTCMTFLTSSPRAETPVATKMGVLAWRKPRLERKDVSHLPREPPESETLTMHPPAPVEFGQSEWMCSGAPCYTDSHQRNRPGSCY
jgi:hypothetical protein